MHNKKGSQIDIAVLDFSKAFDTVPHDSLFSTQAYMSKFDYGFIIFKKKQETKYRS